MSEHRATVRWTNDQADFQYDTYSRDHLWNFNDSVEVAASAAAEYSGTPARVDPEQALVAAVASCHMLTFLAIAAKKKLHVTSYVDEPVGILEQNEQGRLAITRITLKPQIAFAGESPDEEKITKIHHTAHEHCFIANSVNCKVTVE